MFFYVFGSLCRGEIDEGSDVDVLAIVTHPTKAISPLQFSVYTEDRISELWREGNPFAWHLHLEAKLVFASNGVDWLRTLGTPAPYRCAREDCLKFAELFQSSVTSLASSEATAIFDLSTVFLAIRNFATCFSLGEAEPDFSRDSARRLGPRSIGISDDAFEILARARILSTRGYGAMITNDEVVLARNSLGEVGNWMNMLLAEVSDVGV